MAEQDITKTGPVGLRGLQGLNRQQKQDYSQVDYEQMRRNAFRGVDTTPPDASLFVPQHRDISDPLASWGSSDYDTLSPYIDDVDTLNEARYENQSTISAMGNALAKMLGTAATTIVSGLGNIIYGPATAISEGRWSGLWDNELTQALSGVDKYMKDNFKIYQSKEQQNAPWLSMTNLTSASFWGDDVIRNAGFMLGAAASGSVFTGGLGLASRALGLVSKATNASKITTGILGSLFSAAGEGAIEAKLTMESLVELNNQRLDDELNRQLEEAYQEYLATGDSYYYSQRLQDIEARGISGKQQILQDARSAGNWDMALNIPILTLSNFITLGRGFSKSFSNARKMTEAANKADGSSLIGGVDRSRFRDAFKKAQNGEAIEGIESTLKNTKLRRTWEVTKPILFEGSEEMNQQFASSFAGYFRGNREDVNDYWKARMNPGAEQDTISAWTAIGKGFMDSWGSYDQWEQFFVGGLMGATGMPMPTKTFGGSKEDQGKKWYNPSKYFSWEGGSFQNLKDFNRRLDAATQANEELNKRYKDPDFWNRMRSGVAHSYFQTTMDDAVANDDIKSYKDAEEKQFVQDLDAFVKAGKVDDFRALINTSTQELSDEDIADLISRNTAIVTKEQDEADKRNAILRRIDALEGTIQVDGENMKDSERKEYQSQIAQLTSDLNSIVGEEQKIGLYTDSHGNLTKSYDEIRQELQENGRKLNERVDSYLESISVVNNMSQGRLTSDQEGNLAYLHYMGKAARKRANQLMDRYNIPNTFTINPGKEETIESVQKFLGLPEGSVTKNDNGTFIVNISSLNGEKKRDTYLDIALGHDRESAEENAKNMVGNNYGKAIDVYDAIKLNSDSREFMRVFGEYMAEPTKVDEDKAKAEKEADKEIKNANIDGKSISEIVEDAENGDIDISSDEFNFTDDEMDIINGKKPDSAITPEMERKQKVNTAKEIIDIKNQAKAKARAFGLDDATMGDLEAMIDKSGSSAESADDALDTDTEAFNDPESLSTTQDEQQLLEVINDPNSNLEDVEAARQLYQESRQQRLDEIKNIVQQIKEGVANDLEELKRMPKSGPNAPKSLGTMEDNNSKDPTEATPTTNKKSNIKEVEQEEIPTPDTQVINLEEQSDIPKQMPEKGYWKGNTTEYPIHRDKTNNRPFYEQIDDKTRQAISKATYTFLKETGAYERIKNNEIKPGQKVKFAISKRLTNAINKATGQGTPVILVIDENSNVLCDLPCPACVTIFNKYPGLKEFYDEAVKYTNEHFNDNTDDLIIIPDFESSISRPYIGRPLYSANDSSGKRVDHTLNEIADGRPFKIGLALTSSPNPTMIMTPGRRKTQGPSMEDLTIVKPNSGLAGQPYLLVETSDPNRKWLPVPITMPTFSSSNSARLSQIVTNHLLQLSNPQELLTEEQQIAWKNGLKDLLSVGDVYLEVKPKQDNNGYTVNFRIKRLKSDTAWTTVYNGEIGDGNLLIQRVGSLNIPYQISRKYINSQFNGQDYNSLIGELASTNLEIGALHTVNDFFTINPIINGKQQKAKPIQDAPRDAENKAKATRENTFVTGNIVPDQANVNRDRTDSDYYYIKESDGKYHRYQRVHSILPVNSNNTGSSNRQRALRTGSAIDTIIRDFFNTGKTTKPDFISNEAYNSILKYLNTLDKWLKDHKWTIYANNIVLYNKYPDGRRIAGEVDLLLVDDKGNYHIYDVKTSAGSFAGDYFEGVHSNWGQQMSTKNYYTLQVSSYAKLLNDRFGKKVSSVALVPFNVVYGDNDNVTAVTKVPNIALPIIDADSPNVSLKEAQRRREEITKPDTSEPKISVATARENLGNNKLFKSQKWQNRLSRLNDENILGLNEMAKRNPILKRTLDHLDAKIKNTMSDEELNNLVAEQLKPKNREVEITAQEQNSIEKELEVIEKLLPQLNQEGRVRIVDSLINIPNGRAWGQFKDGVIALYRNAARGTAYHEAFHFVFNTLMTDEELEMAYDSAEKRYGNLSSLELEERLAEEFRQYMQNEETFVGRLKNLWSKLKALLNHLNGNWNYLDRIYADISRGKYSNREVRDNQNTRNRVVPTVPFMQDIVDSQVNNAAHTRIGKNKEWGRIADIWKREGYRLRGHYDTQSKKYIVTSVTPIFTTEELRQYHANRLAYGNLDQESKDYLSERHISPQEYENMTLKEKEVLFRCMY